MFAWAPIPEPYREMGSIEFAKMLVTEAHVAVSPGVGFGPGGDGHVRFALIENEQRIAPGHPQPPQALTKLGLTERPQPEVEATEAEGDGGVGHLADAARCGGA